MAITYTDGNIYKGNDDRHPALKVDEKHPCYLMTREKIDGKSVFHWDKQQAYQMYKYYIVAWNPDPKITDEFGEGVYISDFKKFLKSSHYMAKRNTPSEETIEELWNAAEMEKKILASNGDSEDE